MNQWTVLNGVRRYMTVEDNGSELLSICNAAQQEIRSKLRSDADEDDPRVAQAAAGLAYYKYALRALTDEQSVVSFKAGDVIVSQSAGAALELATRIRDETYLDSAPLLRDDAFIFTKA